MTKSIVFALAAILLVGCKEYILKVCSDMCRPNLALKYENANCYCQAQTPPLDAGK